MIQDAVNGMIRDEFDTMWKGDKESLQNLPVESLMPLLFLKHISTVAKNFEVTPEFFEYGMDPDQGFGRKAPSARKNKMLKEIDSKFSETGDGEDD